MINMQAIEFKLKQLNKLVGHEIKIDNGQIISWSANGEHQPDQATLDAWTTEYQVAQDSENNNKKGRKRQLLDALATLTGLTRKQVLKCFTEIVKDQNDD